MTRCPKCGMDVSTALRVCGVCQTKLDGEPAAASSMPAAAPRPPGSPAPSRATIAKIGVVFMLLWPFVSLAIGLSPVSVFMVWFVGAILFGVLGKADFALTSRPKTISVPVFGELTAAKWEAGHDTLWEGELRASTAERPLEIFVFGKHDGPSQAQAALASKLLRDLPTLRSAALEALAKLDRSEWPAEARAAAPELTAIELNDDEETAEGRFTLRFEALGDSDGSYYVDFQHDAVDEAYRIG